MSDKPDLPVPESRIAQNMVGMNVRIDDIAHRFRGNSLDGGCQRPAFLRTPAGIDHGNAFIADDKTDIGDTRRFEYYPRLAGTQVNAVIYLFQPPARPAGNRAQGEHTEKQPLECQTQV
jgi:hypothetical protein